MTHAVVPTYTFGNTASEIESIVDGMIACAREQLRIKDDCVCAAIGVLQTSEFPRKILDLVTARIEEKFEHLDSLKVNVRHGKRGYWFNLIWNVPKYEEVVCSVPVKPIDHSKINSRQLTGTQRYMEQHPDIARHLKEFSQYLVQCGREKMTTEYEKGRATIFVAQRPLPEKVPTPKTHWGSTSYCTLLLGPRVFEHRESDPTLMPGGKTAAVIVQETLGHKVVLIWRPDGLHVDLIW